MANKKNWLGILAIVLVFGMMVAGCDNGDNNKNNDYSEKSSITIINLPTTSSFSVVVYNYDGEITSLGTWNNALTKPIAASDGYFTGQKAALYSIDLQSNLTSNKPFTQSGTFLVAIVNYSKETPEFLFTTRVDFVNGYAASSYNAFRPITDIGGAKIGISNIPQDASFVITVYDYEKPMYLFSDWTDAAAHIIASSIGTVSNYYGGDYINLLAFGETDGMTRNGKYLVTVSILTSTDKTGTYYLSDVNFNISDYIAYGFIDFDDMINILELPLMREVKSLELSTTKITYSPPFESLDLSTFSLIAHFNDNTEEDWSNKIINSELLIDGFDIEYYGGKALTVTYDLILTSIVSNECYVQYDSPLKTKIDQAFLLSDDVTIIIDEDMEFEGYGIEGNKSLTLKGDEIERTITFVGSGGNMFDIGYGSKLTLGNNICLDGNNIAETVVYGWMNELVLAGGKITGGHRGVHYENGTFIMESGEIYNNTANGVFCEGSRNNDGDPSFIMKGGKIHGNGSLDVDQGGGVYIFAGRDVDSSFIMEGCIFRSDLNMKCATLEQKCENT